MPDAPTAREAIEAAIDRVIPTDRIVQRHDIKRAADHAIVALRDVSLDELATLLDATGDVCEGSLCAVCGRLDEAVGIIGRHKDRRHDRDGYSSLEHWCENQDGRQWQRVLVVAAKGSSDAPKGAVDA